MKKPKKYHFTLPHPVICILPLTYIQFLINGGSRLFVRCFSTFETPLFQIGYVRQVFGGRTKRKVKNKPETWFVWNIFSIFAL
jgi:hypothetical protein